MNIDFSKMVTAEDKKANEEQAEREAFKLQRTQAVAGIKVTTAAGNEFQGDERSQGRMARAILGLEAKGEGSTILWVLADNTVIDATASELREALILSGQAQADLWVP